MLRRDLTKRNDVSPEIELVVDDLLRLELIKSEFVIICKRTSEQINRVRNVDIVNMMASYGVKCKCGKLISDERVEEILATTDLANKMVDGNHWMTIGLVDSLRRRGLTTDQIMVNVVDGPEEIDAFVSIGGDLLMFELKDSQFSMGHAYAFAGRLGLNEPDHGVIWASGGVAPEVKEHFKRVEPNADVHYVENLDDLDPFLENLITGIKLEMAREYLLPLRDMLAFDIPGALISELRHAKQANQNSSLQAAVAMDQKKLERNRTLERIATNEPMLSF